MFLKNQLLNIYDSGAPFEQEYDKDSTKKMIYR
jgi:hypothetical protein